MSAARHADILFVKTKDNGENDLATYCTREGIPHVLFQSFEKVLPAFQALVKGEKSKEDILAMGTVWNPVVVRIE